MEEIKLTGSYQHGESLSRKDMKTIKGGVALAPGDNCRFGGIGIPATICLISTCEHAGLPSYAGANCNPGEYCCVGNP